MFHRTRAIQLIAVALGAPLFTGCAGKYIVNTYPAGAKVYIKDIQTKDRKLIGVSPVQITEDSKLGEVFFLEIEKENYQNKEIMVKVNPGESLMVSSRLDVLNPGSEELGKDVAKNDDKQQPQQPPKEDDKKKQDDELAKKLKEEIDELKLRVALLENTSDVHREAIFSARFKGGPAGSDRDEQETLISRLFESQQAIMRGDYAKALQLLDRALAADQYSANAWMLKGSVSYLQKDYASARIAWEKTLKLDPFNKTAYRYLSEVYKRLGLNELPPQGTEIRRPATVLEIEKRKTGLGGAQP